MKKATCTSLIILFLLVTTQSFAYMSENITLEQKLIYCPQEITCTETGNLSSCKYINETPQFWGKLDSVMRSTLIEGTYKLWRVRSGYHNNYAYTDCNYVYKTQDKGEQVLDLIAKDGAFLEANFKNYTQWTDNGMNGINCQSNDPTVCPLSEASGLGVVFTKIDVNKYSITPSMPFINLDGRRFSISYDNAASCWGYKNCEINFAMISKDSGRVAIGSVIVDMDNRMKIIKVHPIETSGVTISKIDGINAIEITKLDDPSVISSVDFVNSTGSEINIFSKDILVSTINAWDHGGLFSNRLDKACSKKQKCLVVLKSLNGGLIGSLMIDVKNKMTILSASATRPSEITFNVVDAHKVEVRYP